MIHSDKIGYFNCHGLRGSGEKCKDTSMKQKNMTFRKWLMRFLILFSFAGIGLWLAAGSIEGLQREVNRAYASEPSRSRPEIDLRIPEITEKALFALG